MSRKKHFEFRGAEFASSESGNAAMIFGLSLVPVILMLAATADYTRFTITRARLQQAVDAGVLAAAGQMTASTTLDQARAQATRIIQAQPTMATAVVSNPRIVNNQSFCVDAQIALSSSILKISTLPANLTPSVTACADMAGTVSPDTTYEIALVLDNSGSMSRSTDGQSKMQALQSAAKSFVTTMFSKTQKVKVAVTPFAANVVAVDPSDRSEPWMDTQGQSSQHWIAFGDKTAANNAGFNSRFDIFSKLKARNSQLDWRGCFEALTYPKNVNDTTPSAGDPDSLLVPYLAPDEPNKKKRSWSYNNSYLNDSSAPCVDTPTTEWPLLTHVCKYNATGSLSGSFGPTNFSGSSSFCPDPTTQAILQLNGTEQTINSKIGQLVANGNTNLHEGFMWGWRTISPNGPFAAGRAYSTVNNRKVMVFMTDGFNNWGSQPGTVVGSNYEAAGYYSYNGQANIRMPDGTQGDHVNYRDQLKAAGVNSSDYHSTSRDAQDELTREACTNAKTQGIEVFTIGFSISTDPIDQQGLDLLKSCATNEAHYFAATDTSQLNAAFASIGVALGKLHLSL